MTTWKISLAALVALAGSLVYGEDLVDANRRLKAELTEQRQQLQPLHAKNRELEVRIEALRVVNDLITGRLKTPPPDAPSPQTVVWDDALDSSRTYRGADWPRYAQSVKDGETTVLKITRTAEEKDNTIVPKWFSKEDLAQTKGKTITCTVMCKGESIGDDGKACFMLMVPRASQATAWPDAQIGKGSFGWRPVTFRYTVPLDATGVMLILGLQGATGSVYYKDLKVTVSE